MTSLQELAKRRTSLRLRLINRISRHYTTSVNDAIREHDEFKDFSDAHMQVVFFLELEGTRITTLAQRANISVQAMGKLIRDMEGKGYVERKPDPEDGRAQRILLTQKGERFFALAIGFLEEAEAQLESILGEDAHAQLTASLIKIATHVDPDGF